MERIFISEAVFSHWWCHRCRQLWVDYMGALTQCEEREHLAAAHNDLGSAP